MYYVTYVTVEWGSKWDTKWDTDQTVSPKIEQNSLHKSQRNFGLILFTVFRKIACQKLTKFKNFEHKLIIKLHIGDSG